VLAPLVFDPIVHIGYGQKAQCNVELTSRMQHSFRIKFIEGLTANRRQHR
jgi:hypothetical protein